MTDSTSSDLAKRANRRRFLKPFLGEALDVPPVWLMRQAGRYLPEYRSTRTKAGSFLDLCYNPQLAAEVTLQPIRRFGFDAAILFSDILVVPHALGQDVRFLEGEGPKLAPIRSTAGLSDLDVAATREKFGLVWETVARLRADLPDETALIGFCGAPWTVATYMVEGEGSTDQAQARIWAYRDPEGFGRLIDLLVETSIEYLDGQIRAGADAVQIFDTWAGSLPPAEVRSWVTGPVARIVAAIRSRHPGIPMLAFPRGVGGQTLMSFLGATGLGTGPSGVSLGTAVDLTEASAALQAAGLSVVTQGNLDPLALVAGGAPLEHGVRSILQATAGRPHIFNLGHGIVPQTPPDHVGRLMDLVRRGET
ncbi:MAG: uroporphyrinogen decarboxylase [Hyphomicrobiaceae bacterium]